MQISQSKTAAATQATTATSAAAAAANMLRDFTFNI